MQNNSEHKTLPILTILKESTLLYKANFLFLFSISLLGHILFLFVPSLIVSKIFGGWISLVIIVGGFVYCWGYTALIFAVSKIYSNQEIGIKEALAATKDKVLRFIVANIYCFLFFIIGFLLFVVPAFYLQVIFLLTDVIIVLENVTVFELFKRSKDLIRGYFWQMFSLSLILFAVSFLPPLVLCKLNFGNTKYLITDLISPLITPWSIAICINIYNRLKMIKGYDIEIKSANKGVGCLGCLGVVGLCIIVIILNVFWFKGIGGFLKTKKGGKVYEWVAAKMSPKIELPDGVILDRPEEFLVIKSQGEYHLYPSPNKKQFAVSVFSVSLKDLGIADKLFKSQEQLWDKYYAYLIQRSPLWESKFSKMEKDSLELVDLRGRHWTRYRWKEKQRKSGKLQEVWVYDYILTDNSIIFVAYGYKSNYEEEDLIYNEEVQRILSNFYFNK